MQAPVETALVRLGVTGETKALPFAPARPGSRIGITLANDTHVKVDAAVDEAALVRVLRAVKAAK